MVPDNDVPPPMSKIEKEIMVMNKQGLHARPAAQFVQIATKYDAKIMLKKDEEIVNGKSIMGILMLGAQHQSKLTLIVDGQDADQAATELEGFLSRNE